MQFDGTTKLHRKSGFGLHQSRNRYIPKDGSKDARVAATVDDGKDKERLFMGRVGDEKVTYSHESHGAGSEGRRWP